MIMYERLKQEKITALKAKDQVAKRLIPYVLDIANKKDGIVGSNSGATASDQAIYDAINKVIADNKELLKNKDNDKLVAEIAYLETLLPKVYSEDKLQAVIDSYSFDNIGAYMKALSADHPGKIDKPLASRLVAAKLRK